MIVKDKWIIIKRNRMVGEGDEGRAFTLFNPDSHY